MSGSLKDWRGCEAPAPVVLEGREVRLEPLDAERHGRDLAALDAHEQGERLYRYLPEMRPADEAESLALLRRYQADPTWVSFAVVDRASERADGRQALMRIDAANGSLEIGAVLWGPKIARRRAATEAFFLLAAHVFDTLGYRRLEWKCNALNGPSRHAALRFGFTYEGTFRQHMVRKGENRDTDWFSIIDGEWPSRRRALHTWLAPENFDADGVQREKLATFQPWRSPA